ncbi:hypothetical protein [Streptosporangium sp. NPDC023615]|uniref:hypothetical protein n=1 Tax=Streptosporangium sp. NPDC023615 TaxID=3154794 RepID=UPI00343EEBFB
MDLLTIHNYRCANREFDQAVVCASFAAGGDCSPVFTATPPYKDRLLQARIIRDISEGGSCLEDDLVRVVEGYGYRLRQVWLWRKYDDVWLLAFETALMNVRNPNLAHGTKNAWLRVRCKCIYCRAMGLREPHRGHYISQWLRLSKEFGGTGLDVHPGA